MRYKKAKEEAETMKVMSINGKYHVIKHSFRNAYECDYKGTGMVLAGILKPGQSLEDFKNEWMKEKMGIKNL
jgi:hypothetical protein